MSKLIALFRLTFIVLLAGAGLVLILALLLGDWDKGLTAYKKGDYATALREWQPFAEQGFADAQNNLGAMYAEGEGMPQDDRMAVQWYRRAAEQGNATAQAMLDAMYAR